MSARLVGVADLALPARARPDNGSRHRVLIAETAASADGRLTLLPRHEAAVVGICIVARAPRIIGALRARRVRYGEARRDDGECREYAHLFSPKRSVRDDATIISERLFS